MGFLNKIFGGAKEEDSQQAKTEEKNFELLKYDGVRAQRLGKLTYAIKCWEEALTLKKEEETLALLATAYTQANRLDEAKNMLQTVIELVPYKSDYLISLAQIDYMQEQYDSMQQACKQALEIEKKEPIIYLLSAKADIGLKNEIGAIASLTRVLALKPDYIAAYLLRAEVLWKMHQINDAAEDVEAVLDLEPESEEALLLKGEILFATKRVEEAEVCFTQLLQLNPFNEKAYLFLGNLYLETKSFEKALAIYDEAIEINPKCAEFYHERGRVKLLKGDKEGSMMDMKRSIEMAPEGNSRFDGKHNNYENITKKVPW
ncbi:MAG: tetratricopeptide repeat protein [Phocaeicola sp.]